MAQVYTGVNASIYAFCYYQTLEILQIKVYEILYFIFEILSILKYFLNCRKLKIFLWICIDCINKQ